MDTCADARLKNPVVPVYPEKFDDLLYFL